MNQRQRILELVKNDTITIEQGMELMSALEMPNRLPTRPPVPPMPPAPPAWKTNASSVRVGRPLASGNGQLSFDEIVQLGVHGIKPNYIEELRKAGLEDMEFHDLMQLVIHEIPVSYVLELRDLEQQLEIEPLTVNQIVQLGIHGISAEYALEMRRLGIEHGFEPLTVDQIVQLGIHDIQPSYVLELLKTGAFSLNMFPAAEKNPEQRRAQLKVKPEKAAPMSGSVRLEEKLARAEAKRERAMAKRERQGLDDESDDELEPDSEADAPRATVQRWFEIKDFVDSSLPIAVQRQVLEEMLQDINADIGVSTDDVERAALLNIYARITAELSQLPAA